jgi:hypothetical protein
MRPFNGLSIFLDELSPTAQIERISSTGPIHDGNRIRPVSPTSEQICTLGTLIIIKRSILAGDFVA